MVEIAIASESGLSMIVAVEESTKDGVMPETDIELKFETTEDEVMPETVSSPSDGELKFKVLYTGCSGGQFVNSTVSSPSDIYLHDLNLKLSLA